MVLSSIDSNPTIGNENCIKVKATVAKNSMGQYGILFHNVKFSTTYYTTPYSIYERNGMQKILYGETKSFTPQQ
jgi:hypothetical protein